MTYRQEPAAAVATATELTRELHDTSGSSGSRNGDGCSGSAIAEAATEAEPAAAQPDNSGGSGGGNSS